MVRPVLLNVEEVDEGVCDELEPHREPRREFVLPLVVGSPVKLPPPNKPEA